MNNQTLLVAKNVYRTRIKGAGFWVMILTPLLIPLISIVVGLIVGSGATHPRLAVVDNPPLVQVLKAAKSIDATISEVDNTTNARKQLNNGDIDGYLTTDNSKYSLYTTNKTNAKFDQAAYQTALTQVQILETAQKMGLSAEQLKTLLAPASLTMSVVSGDTTSAGGTAKLAGTMGASVFTAVVMLIILMMYVTIVAQEVANEKSSRIMETLLATTSASTQYYGKILGVIGLAVTQIVIYAAGFGIASFFLKNNSTLSMISGLLSGVNTGFFVYAILMLLVSIVGYLFVSSIIASLVNEQSQVQQATQPIAFFSIIGYIASIAGASVPSNIVLRVLSFIPFVSPTLMTSRLASQFSSTTEAWIALGLQFIATVAVAKAGEKIYARNVLSYSSDKIMTQFFRNLRGGSDKVKTVKTAASTDSAPANESYLQRRLRLIKEQPWRIGVLVVVIIILILRFVFFRK